MPINIRTYNDRVQVTSGGGGGGSYTNEEAQDAVGGILVDSSEIDFTYDDVTPSISASILTIAQSKITNLIADLAAKVGITRQINTTSPITGGGNLSADRTIQFDQTVDLNNNARIAVRKNTGLDVGERRRLNLIEGSNITLTITDDSGDEEVDIIVGGTVTQYSDEQAQDAIGTILVDSSTIDFIYNDGVPSITAGIIPSVDLDNNARIAIRRNTGADIGERRRLNFIEGSNVTMTITDDPANEEIDITINSTGGGGGSGNAGSAVLDFGVFPGSSDANIVVTGQASIVAGSILEAWIRPVNSSDHTADEHMIETIKIYAGNIIAGTGFTIYGFNDGQLNENRYQSEGRGRESNSRGTRIYGQWNVAWRWS